MVSQTQPAGWSSPTRRHGNGLRPANGDREVRALESPHALENPHDFLADNRVGRIEGLRKQAYRLGGLPVFVGDVAANALAPVWLGLDRPVELEPVLPALHQGGRGSGRGQVRARGPTRRRGDGRQCEQYGCEDRSGVRGHGACLSSTGGRAPAGKLMMSPFGVRPSSGGVYTSWSESLRSQCPGTKTGLSVPGT